MLPLWRDRIGIALCPDRIILVRVSRGLRPRISNKAIVQVQPHKGSPSWHTALDKLGAIVKEKEWQKADATVILSNHFVRYACIPWSSSINGKTEEMAFASLWFTQSYGSSARDLDLRVDSRQRSKMKVASGLDGGLADAIRQTISENSLQLLSIQPYWMATVNRFRKQLSNLNAWFVVVEPGNLCMALMQAGEWRHLSNRTLDELSQASLFLDRENLLCGIDEPCREIILFAPESGASEIAIPNYRVNRFALTTCQGFSVYDDAQYSMAITGAA